jgi:hypothetical protein
LYAQRQEYNTTSSKPPSSYVHSLPIIIVFFIVCEIELVSSPEWKKVTSMEILTRVRNLTLPSRKRTSQRASQTTLSFSTRSGSTSSSTTGGWRGGFTSRNCRSTTIALLGVGNLLESRATANVVQQAVATGYGDLWHGCSGVGSHADISPRCARRHRRWGRGTAR